MRIFLILHSLVTALCVVKRCRPWPSEGVSCSPPAQPGSTQSTTNPPGRAVDPRLARVCREFLAAPSLDTGIDDMAERAGMSRRTFTRQFRQHTGISYLEWRQQACLLAAVVQLDNGEPVTRVVMDLGDSSASAFSTVFRNVLGEVPSRYFGN